MNHNTHSHAICGKGLKTGRIYLLLCYRETVGKVMHQLRLLFIVFTHIYLDLMCSHFSEHVPSHSLCNVLTLSSLIP